MKLKKVILASALILSGIYATTLPTDTTKAEAATTTGTTTFTVASKTSCTVDGDAKEEIKATFSQTYTGNGIGQMTANNSTTLNIKAPNYTLKKLVLNMKSNKSSGSGSVKIGNETIVEGAFNTWLGNKSYSQEYIDLTYTVPSDKKFDLSDCDIMIAATVKSLYIKKYTIEWEYPACEVTFDSMGGTEVAPAYVKPGNKINKPTETMTKPDSNGKSYTFDGWYKTTNFLDTDKWNFDTDVVNGDITLYAKWNETAVGASDSFVKTETKANLSFSYTESVAGEPIYYEKVTSASNLKVGDIIVITSTDDVKALSTTQGGNNRSAVTITENIEKTENAERLTLVEGSKTGTFGLMDTSYEGGNGYLYAASTSSNHLRTQTTMDDNSSWKITINTSGVASVVAQGTNTRNTLQYNSGSNIFSCYESGKQEGISIYKQMGGITTTYKNFKNLKMKYQYEFDFTPYADQSLSSGLILTNELDFVTNNATKLSTDKDGTEFATTVTNKTNYKVFNNTTLKGQYTVSVNFKDTELTQAIMSKPLLAVAYIKTTEGYFFNTPKNYSVIGMLDEYSKRTDSLEYTNADGSKTLIKIADLAAAFKAQIEATATAE